MARALRDAGFKNVDVNLGTIVLDDGVCYQVDDDLVKWQRDAMGGQGMSPIAMKFCREHRLVELVEEL